MRESQTLSDEIKMSLQKEVAGDKKEVSRSFTIAKKERPIPQSTMSTKPVGKIVQNEFIALLKSDKINKNIIHFLEQSDYSKQIFDVNYPILLHINSLSDSKKGVDHNGINRYYAKPIQLQGELYLVTSQWFDRNKDKLIHWINSFI